MSNLSTIQAAASQPAPAPEVNDSEQILAKVQAAFPDDDQILAIIELGLKFKKAQSGRSVDYFGRYLDGVIQRLHSPTFKNLLEELELEAARRDMYGVRASPIEKVDRVWELVTFHSKKERLQMPFSTLRNRLTQSKKRIITKP